MFNLNAINLLNLLLLYSLCSVLFFVTPLAEVQYRSVPCPHVLVSWWPVAWWPPLSIQPPMSPVCGHWSPPALLTRPRPSPNTHRPPATLTLLPHTIETSWVHLWGVSVTSISCYGLLGPVILYSGANSSSFSSKSNRVLTETRILCLGLSLPLLLILLHCVCSRQ